MLLTRRLLEMLLFLYTTLLTQYLESSSQVYVYPCIWYITSVKVEKFPSSFFTWYNWLNTVKNHGNTKKKSQTRDSNLHLLAISKDDSKMVLGYQDNWRKEYPNAERLYACHYYWVLCSPWMSWTKLIGHSNTATKKKKGRVFYLLGRVETCLGSKKMGKKILFYLIAALIPMNNMPSHPFIFMLKWCSLES